MSIMPGFALSNAPFKSIKTVYSFVIPALTLCMHYCVFLPGRNPYRHLASFSLIICRSLARTILSKNLHRQEVREIGLNCPGLPGLGMGMITDFFHSAGMGPPIQIMLKSLSTGLQLTVDKNLMTL